jgi:hypothetical protein
MNPVRLAAFLVPLGIVLTSLAAAQNWPAKPLRVIVNFAPDGYSFLSSAGNGERFGEIVRAAGIRID